MAQALNVSESAAPAMHRRLARRILLLSALEAAALAQLLLELLLPRELQLHAQNVAPVWFRGLSLALPVLAALGVSVALWLRLRAGQATELRTWARRAAPLLAIWPAPVLLSPATFVDRPVFLLLVTGAVGLGLQHSCRQAAPAYRAARLKLRVTSLRSSRAVPRLLASLAILAAAAFILVGSLVLHARMLSSTYDLGLFENLFWNTLHGRHGIALGEHYFREHAEFLLYLLLPVYALAPRAETLLVLQTVLMVGAAVPLFLLAERWLRSGWVALIFVLAYLSHPALHGPAFYDFHFLPLSAFFLLWAAYFHARHAGGLAFWLAVLLALCCREDVAISVAAVGAGLAWNARQRNAGAVRQGLVLAATGLAWFVLIKFVWMRQFGPLRFASYYSELISPPVKNFGGVLFTVASNPLYTLSRLLSEDKLLLALQLLVPLAFLPLRYRRAWFLLVPGLVVVGLANSGSTIVDVHYHYATHFLPLMFVAAIFALAVRSRHSRAPVVLALAFCSLVSAVRFSAFQPASATDRFSHVSFGWTADDSARLEAFRSVAALIPAEASLSVGEYEGPHLARRATLLALKLGIGDAAYVLYSDRSLRWGGCEEVQRVLGNGSYGVLDTAGDFVLLARGHSTLHNGEILQRLR
jgi:uncharacterized membrane protein